MNYQLIVNKEDSVVDYTRWRSGKQREARRKIREYCVQYETT